nr:hypothetical protein [Candidatus Sigynarchaeota archaeon]
MFIILIPVLISGAISITNASHDRDSFDNVFLPSETNLRNDGITIDENFDDHFIEGAKIESGGSEGLWSGVPVGATTSIAEMRDGSLKMHINDNLGYGYVWHSYDCEDSPAIPSSENRFEASIEVEMIAGTAFPMCLFQDGVHRINIGLNLGRVVYVSEGVWRQTNLTYNDGDKFRLTVTCLSTSTFKLQLAFASGLIVVSGSLAN